MFYGWYIVIASSIIAGYNSLLFIYGFSSFINPIIGTFSWTRAQIALAITFNYITSGVLNPFIGFLVDRWPAKRLMLIGGLIMGFAYFSLSRATTLPTFYLGYVLIGMGASLAVSLVPSTTIVRWFNKNLGKANGITGFCIAIGGIAVPLLVLVIDTYGWQDTFLFAAVGSWILIIPLSFLFRNRPEEYGLNPDGIQIRDDQNPIKKNIEIPGVWVKEALKSRSFWLIGFGTTVQSGSAVAILTHIIPNFMDIGFERSYASLIVMTIAIVGLAVRIPIGWLMDITSRRNVIALSIGLTGISCFLLWLIKADSPFILVLIFAIPFGIGNGSIWVRPALNREYFGTKRFGTISGLLLIFSIIGTSVFPVCTGLVFDAVENYGPAFLTLGVLNIIGALLTMLLPRIIKNK